MNSRLESGMLPPTIVENQVRREGELLHHRVDHRVEHHKNQRLYEVTSKVQPSKAPEFQTTINQPSHRLPHLRHLNSHSRRRRQFLGAAAVAVAV